VIPRKAASLSPPLSLRSNAGTMGKSLRPQGAIVTW
jgi:hypothetical protein